MELVSEPDNEMYKNREGTFAGRLQTQPKTTSEQSIMPKAIIAEEEIFVCPGEAESPFDLTFWAEDLMILGISAWFNEFAARRTLTGTALHS